MRCIRLLPGRVVLSHLFVYCAVGLKVVFTFRCCGGLITCALGASCGRSRCPVIRHITGQATLHDLAHNITVVAFEDDELERRKLSRFVVVRRYLRVLLVRVFPRLHEPLALLFKLCVDIRKFLGRELAQELAHELFLVILQVFSLLLSRSQVSLSFFEARGCVRLRLTCNGWPNGLRGSHSPLPLRLLLRHPFPRVGAEVRLPALGRRCILFTSDTCLAMGTVLELLQSSGRSAIV